MSWPGHQGTGPGAPRPVNQLRRDNRTEQAADAQGQPVGAVKKPQDLTGDQRSTTLAGIATTNKDLFWVFQIKAQ